MLPTTQTLFANHYVRIGLKKQKLNDDENALILIQLMMAVFFADNTDSFEKTYVSWEIWAALYGIKLPSIEDCEAALNDQACNELRFAEYFINHFNL